MPVSTTPPRPPRESPLRFAVLVSALVGALALGAVIAQQRAEARPVETIDKAASAWLRCPPNACNRPIERPPATTAPVTTVWVRPTTTRPAATTTRRPVTTTTRRPPPTTTRRPVTTTTRRPPPTTTRRPVTTTTRRPPPTTTRRPVTTTTTRRLTPTTTAPSPTTTQANGSNEGCGSWACDEINSGVDNGYLPEDFDPQRPTQTADLETVIEAYGQHNDGFDTDAALQALQDANPDEQADRGDMLLAIAAGLGIDIDPDADPFEVADELADLDILLGHDGDGDGVADPYTRPDADPDSTMTNAQLAAFLDRIPIANDPGGGGGGGPGGSPFVSRPPGGGGGGGGGSPGGGGDPDDETCTTGLALTYSERAAFVEQLRWETLVGIEAQSEPGVPWPPHPDVPGGAEFLVVSQSPVWPVVDPGAQWYPVADDGCLWVATGVQTRVSQLLPWRTDHRRVLENAGTFGVYLRRWDNLTSEQQARTIQRHRSRDLDVRCPLETAMVSPDSYNRCRWEVPVSGVWSWQARACFEADTGSTTYRDCGTLAQGIEWFLGIIDYTSGITLHHDPGGRAGAAPRHPAPAN